MLADTWHLFNKYMKITFRMPMWTLFTLVQPLIWLIIFGQLFKNITQLPGFPTENYMDFFEPGVLIMTVLIGVLHSTAQVVVHVLIMLIVAKAHSAELNLNPLYLILSMLVVVLLGLC